MSVVDYTHSYPHCWRCGTPLIYWAKPTWFARTSAHKADLLRENETVGWHPEHIKHGRFGDWLENNVDWALSRDRYWGTPIPVWRCRDCGLDTCVGSVAELSKLAGRDLSELDLHRPYVDDIVINCPECDGRAFRIEPVLDAWFDSGSMPAAQFHYPFENTDLFERRFPADFICEAIDQTRGWFYSLLAVNTLVFGHTPYRNVVCLGLLLDRRRPEDVEVARQRDRSARDPREPRRRRAALEHVLGRVAVGRAAHQRREHRRVDPPVPADALEHVLVLRDLRAARRLGTRTPPAAGRHPTAATHVLDRWIASRLEATIDRRHRRARRVRRARRRAGPRPVRRRSLELVRAPVAAALLEVGRPAAHATLHECLVTVTLLLAPYCPFITDEMYANLAGTTDSVHLADWPVGDPSRLDPALDAEMELARQVASLGHSARSDAKIKVRQPLPRAFVLLPASTNLRDEVVAEVAAELNVKQVEVVTSLEGLLDYSVVPNFKALGPRLGKRLPGSRSSSSALDGAEVRRRLDADGTYTLDVDGDPVTLGPDDLQVRAAARGPHPRAGRRSRRRARPHPRRRPAGRGHRPRARAAGERPAQGAGPRALRPDRARDLRRRPDRGSRPPAPDSGSPKRCSRSDLTHRRFDGGPTDPMRRSRRRARRDRRRGATASTGNVAPFSGGA